MTEYTGGGVEGEAKSVLVTVCRLHDWQAQVDESIDGKRWDVLPDQA
jgi:hypothetical protein